MFAVPSKSDGLRRVARSTSGVAPSRRRRSHATAVARATGSGGQPWESESPDASCPGRHDPANRPTDAVTRRASPRAFMSSRAAYDQPKRVGTSSHTVTDARLRSRGSPFPPEQSVRLLRLSGRKRSLPWRGGYTETCRAVYAKDERAAR